MATITGLTADRMLEIEGASVVSGAVDVNNLILTKRDGSTINAGSVRGPIGPAGELWFSGGGVPLNSTGKIGDRWLNEVNGDHYEKTADTTWTLRGNLMPGRPSIVTALPAVTAADHGREVYLKIDEAGAASGPYLWHCKYEHYKADGVTLNPQTYKWAVIAPQPLYSEVVAEETTASGVYVALTTPGPSITVPVAGVYLFRMQLDAYIGAAGSLFMAPQKNGGTIDDVNEVLQIDFSAANKRSTSTYEREMTYALNDALVAKYKASGGTGNFRHRAFQLRPLRIG